MTLATVLSSALSALVLVLALVMPSINSPTVPFGVRIPAEHANDPVVARQTRVYRWRVLVGGIIAAAVGVGIYFLTGVYVLLPLTVLVLLGVWYGCFFLANHEIRTAKAVGGWYEGVRQGITVDTGLRTDPPRFPWLWLAPALIIIVATVVIGVLWYPSMPEMLVVHRTARGGGPRLAAKSVGTAFALVFAQVGVTALLTGIAAAIFHSSRPDIDPAHPKSSASWHRRYMSLAVKTLFGLTAMIDLGLMGSSLLLWSNTVTVWSQLVVVLPILVGVAVTIVILARNNRVRAEGEADTGLAHRDDDKHWKGGMFYVNREDHALMVPRRFGVGWTLNFGNPATAMLGLAVAGLIALAITLRFGG